MNSDSVRLNVLARASAKRFAHAACLGAVVASPLAICKPCAAQNISAGAEANRWTVLATAGEAAPASAIEEARTAGMKSAESFSKSSADWKNLIELARQLQSPNAELRKDASERLAALGLDGRAARWALIMRINDDDPWVRAYAANALWATDRRPELPLKVLTGLLDSQEAGVSDLAMYFLGTMGRDATAAVPRLRMLLGDLRPRTRLLSAEAIARINPADTTAIDTITDAIAANDPEIRVLAAYLVAGFSREQSRLAYPALSKALDDNDGRVRAAAAASLESLGWSLPGQALTQVAERRPLQLHNVSDSRNGGPASVPATTPAAEAKAAVTEQNAAKTTKETAPQSAAVSAAPAAPVKEKPKSPSAKSQPVAARLPLLDQSGDVAARMQKESRSAFSRGLMNLTDYSDHLSLALELKLTAAELAGDEHGAVAALQQQASIYQSTIDQLKAFAQPNTKGWRADLAYAKLLAVETQAAIAEKKHDTAASRSLSAEVRSLASEHYRLRAADYQFGRASLGQLARAAEHLGPDATAAAGPANAPSSKSPAAKTTTAKGTAAKSAADKASQSKTAAAGAGSQPIGDLADYRERLTKIVERSQELKQRGSNIVREDHVLLAQFELSRTNAVQAMTVGDKSRAGAEIQNADELAERLFDKQHDYYKSGTASLFDMSMAWRQQESLNRSAQRLDVKVAPSAAGSQQTHLSELSHMASSVRDLRGRNSADVLLVSGLDNLAQMDQLRTAQAKLAANPKSAAR